jgi:diaminohydroxyphosphoribosylaminopyrimidine deaminase / 5-amino-6-(5-phosphoribosylamino)uracil reductase
LRAAGVRVVMAAAPEALACRELNIGFFSRIERGRPWVRLKVAISLDGQTATEDGRSQWITGPEARADGHAWRRRSSAVMTGIGTVLADDPRLDVRLVPTAAHPLRIVVDTAWRTPAEARVLGEPGRVLVIGCAATSDQARANADNLDRLGVERLEVPVAPDGRPDLGAMWRLLAERGMNEVHVEGGAVLNGSLIKGAWVDELLVYLAPRLLGRGRSLADGASDLDALASRPAWRWVDRLALGDDLRLRARPTSLTEVVGRAYSTPG